MIAVTIFVAVAATCGLMLVRLARGPGLFDRLIAMQGLMLGVAVMAATLFAIDPRWIDAALAIVLIGAALTAAALKAARKQGFQAPFAAGDGGGS